MLAQDKLIKAGVTASPPAQIFEQVKKVAEKDGLKIQIVEFTDQARDCAGSGQVAFCQFAGRARAGQGQAMGGQAGQGLPARRNLHVYSDRVQGFGAGRILSDEGL